MMEAKPVWQSKTFWTSLVTILLPLYPPASAWVAANPEAYSAAIGLIFSGLRIATKEPVKKPKVPFLNR
jgi:hypothetical protein